MKKKPCFPVNTYVEVKSHNNKIGVVIEVINPLGFNEYRVTFVGTSRTIRTNNLDLTEVQVPFDEEGDSELAELNMDELIFQSQDDDDEALASMPLDAQKNPDDMPDIKPAKTRFVKTTDEELDALAASRLSAGTAKMTLYGVRIMKGKYECY